MRTFIINLAGNTDRRNNAERQCAEANLACEFIPAVNGEALPDELLSVIAYNFYENALTKGETGCALSHLHIYSRMVKERIPHCLILEDDAVLPVNISEYLNGLDRLISHTRPEVYLLTSGSAFNQKINVRDKSGKSYHRLIYGSGAYGYVINRQAAQRILNINVPVKYEADRWGIFRDIAGIRVWCSPYPVIKNCCMLPELSTIGTNRSRNAVKRAAAVNSLKRAIPYYHLKRIKNVILSKYKKQESGYCI